MSAVEVFKGDDGWRWRVKGGNGEIVAQSEAYASKQNAVRGVYDLSDIIIEARQDTTAMFATIIENNPSGD